jgi:hypothetical protein
MKNKTMASGLLIEGIPAVSLIDGIPAVSMIDGIPAVSMIDGIPAVGSAVPRQVAPGVPPFARPEPNRRWRSNSAAAPPIG